MIEEPRGRIDYRECGTGPTIVLVPGSCSTGAAWRPVIATWNGQFRCVTIARGRDAGIGRSQGR